MNWYFLFYSLVMMGLMVILSYALFSLVGAVDYVLKGLQLILDVLAQKLRDNDDK